MAEVLQRATRTCFMRVEGGLLRARFFPGADVSAADARENLAASAALCGGRCTPALIDLRGIRSQSSEARAVFAGPEAARVSRAVALLVDSPLTQVLANFFLRFNRPRAETRLFTSEEAAEAWLRERIEPEPAPGGPAAAR